MSIPYDGILSPFLRRKRIMAALPYIQGRVIDVGCGSGALANYVKSACYVGIDKDPAIIRIAKTIYPNHVFYTTEEFHNANNEANKFNTVVSLAVLEHVENPLDFMLFLKSLLAENGKIVITTPHPHSQIIQSLGSKTGLFSSHAHQEHKKLFNAQEMTRLAANVNVKIGENETFLFGMNQLFILSKVQNP
jgi:2-polyprenyl-3-methyl-5-hydroxy-6-metoxy-1,4-benzoquinol methylase